MSERWRAGLLRAPHIVFLVGASLAFIAVLHGGYWHLAFPMDDAYINIGLGRRFFDGTARGEFPSGTTAFGWSLLFGAIFAVVGNWVIAIIFAANVVAGLWIISMLAGLLPQRGRSLPEILFLFWVILFVNLPVLAVLGMEHLWDGALVIAALTALARLIEEERARDGMQLVAFLFLAALCRQETMALGAVIAGILVVHRLYRWAPFVAAAAFLPMVLQGMIQLLQGKSFTANPVAIKVAEGQTTAEVVVYLARKLAYRFMTMDVTLCLGAAIIVLFVLMLRPPTGRTVAARAIAVTTIAYTFAHIVFGQTGWMGRYQVPILACTVTLLAITLPKLNLQRKGAANSLLYVPVLLFGLVWTAADNERFNVLAHLTTVSREVADSPCGIRDVVSLAPRDEAVMMNDVGCTTFFLDNPIVDLYGLTTHQVRKLGAKDGITKRDIDNLARQHGVKMAMIYPGWYEGRIPDDWIEVGGLTTATNRYTSERNVKLYATRPEWRDEIANRWRTYVSKAGKGQSVTFDTIPADRKN